MKNEPTELLTFLNGIFIEENVEEKMLKTYSDKFNSLLFMHKTKELDFSSFIKFTKYNNKKFNELFKYGMQYFCDSSSYLTKPITNRIHYSLLKVENNELVFWEEYNRYTCGRPHASKLILPSSDEVNITDINNTVQVIDWFKSTYATAHYVYVDTPDKQNLLLPFDLS